MLPRSLTDAIDKRMPVFCCHTQADVTFDPVAPPAVLTNPSAAGKHVQLAADSIVDRQAGWTFQSNSGFADHHCHPQELAVYGMHFAYLRTCLPASAQKCSSQQRAACGRTSQHA